MRKIPLILKRPNSAQPWVEFGSTESEYIRWAPEVCSIACVRSILLWRYGTAPSLWELINQAVEHQVFKVTDERIDGAFHFPLVQLLGRHGIRAEVLKAASEDEVWKYLDTGVVMLSVDLPKISQELVGSHIVLVVDKMASQDGLYLVQDSAMIISSDESSEWGTLIEREILKGVSNRKGLIVYDF